MGRIVFFLLAITLYSGTLVAQASLAAVSPARFELAANPGERVQRVLDIYNPGTTPAQFSLRSSEWDFDEAGTSRYSDALKDNSCRPWLRLERRKVSVAPGQSRRLRFEFHVPEDAPSGECRLALFVEDAGAGAKATAASGVSLPVRGRIAVIMYLRLGDAKPQLRIEGVRRGADAKYRILVSNQGTATGRLKSDLLATDAKGLSYDAAVSTLPVLPGQKRGLVLSYSVPGAGESPNRALPKAEPVYPVRLKGRLYRGKEITPVNVLLSGGKR